jgi:hypothetical protein
LACSALGVGNGQSCSMGPLSNSSSGSGSGSSRRRRRRESKGQGFPWGLRECAYVRFKMYKFFLSLMGKAI